MDAVHDAKRLAELQALPLERKIMITQTRIIEWYTHFKGKVCVSFSGGKDSTVLLHIARQLFPDIPAVFVNTGLEYPEIVRFAHQPCVDVVRPKMRFDEVISTYGYPLIGKEVAEAIYYARRIRDRDAGKETEFRRENLEGKTQKPLNPDFRRASLEGEAKLIQTKKLDEYARQRDALEGKRTREPARGTRFNEEPASTRWEGWEKSGPVNPQWYAYEPGDRSRHELTGWGKTGKWVDYPRRALAPDMNNPGDQEIFAKSQFNKERYLPLAREIPVAISHMCCHKMKKAPVHSYQSAHDYVPIIATLAEESRIRKQGWIRTGCNAFEGKSPKSQPMSFWTEQDVLRYIVDFNLDIASVYGSIVAYDEEGNEYDPSSLLTDCKLKCTGCDRTGCTFCAFGFHNEKGETRFQRLARTHPKLYEYALGGGQWADNPRYDPAAPEYDGTWKNWNPQKIWAPSKEGLGMRKVFDMVNEIYGKDFYRYE